MAGAPRRGRVRDARWRALMPNLLVPGLVLASSMIVSLAACGPGRDANRASETVATLPVLTPNAYYVSNRPPLATNPLVKLPLGSVEPRGWLLGQLELMRDGFTGRLAEISRFLKEDSGWITLKGKGWEELPYWLRGYDDLGFLLKDTEVIKVARRWLESAFRSQQPDGYFGPVDNKAAHDLWPNMVMVSAMQTYYEATGDPRVISLMSRYFQYQFRLPVEDLLPESWQKLRGGDDLESIYWLYNRTGQDLLLDLGRRVFERTADWTSPILSPERDRNWVPSSFYHGVNIAMGLRQPAVYYQQSRDPKYLAAVERNYRQVMDEYGQQPGGMFGADENIRPGKRDPRQGAETCSMVEFMASFESLLKITGDPAWADRAEEVAFNSLPASMTPDLKGLHYLTAANMISCDSSGDHDFENTGRLLSYDPWSYRCCQHNVAFGWPYFAEHLWMATADNGLAVVLYAPSAVEARVGDGTTVRITEETAYPFDERVDIAVSAPGPVEFPLYLRIPGWVSEAKIEVNGRAVADDFEGGRYAVLRRSWRDGDLVTVILPMEIRVAIWPGVGQAVSVRRGPLWYSLRIGEQWRRYGGTEAWPAYEILPTTPWNYGLDVDPARPGDAIRVIEVKPPAAQPFTPQAAPVVMKARARRVLSWRADGRMAGMVPQSPAEASGPVEDIVLIPMGCARLRISSFPTVRK
jgi:hypothetical protein